MTERRRDDGGDRARGSETSANESSAAKDPDEWVTGDEPMTGPQRSYLNTLAREAGEEVPDDLTKADASKRIDELQERTGRGVDADADARNHGRTSRGGASG